jgi:CspA family cold shock protein
MPQGIISFWNEDRGFGFVAPDDGSDSIFVHINAVEDEIIDSLPKGARVSFDIGPSKRDPAKMEAKQVKVISK